MRFFENCRRDRRTRIYVPIARILTASGAVNPERLIGNADIQPILHYVGSCTELSPGGAVLLDFGCALHGGIRITEIASPVRIRINFGESVAEATGVPDPDSSVKAAEIDLPRYGMAEYGNTVFRFVRLENVGEAVIKLLNVIAVALECDLEITGSFESSDPRLDRIWKTAIRTVDLSMQDFIYDGAKRDRIVWMGDMHPEIKGILAAYSDVSIITDSLEFLIAQAPADRPMNQIYTYSCWFIISLYEYYWATGDRDFIARHGSYIKTMLDTFCCFVDADGREAIPERRFLDWPNNDNPTAKHAGIQALLYWMMRCGEFLLCELGLDARPVQAVQTLLRRHVPDCGGRKAPAALLTLTGLSDCRDVLEADPFHDVSTFYGYYVLQAKSTIPALELIRRYWGGMLDVGATSFWEDFNLDWIINSGRIDELPTAGKPDPHADFGNYCYKGLRHSLSHGWSCGPAPFLSERISGVRLLTPGGSRISVNPDPGDLEYARIGIPTPHGVITVETGKNRPAAVDVPPGVEIVETEEK